jgi:acetoacetyl-CoA synthetase
VLTNSIDCLLIFLASASIGAIFSSTSPDMGAKGLVERYSQLRPKILICETTVTYGGKVLDLRRKMSEVNETLRGMVSELEQTIVVNGPLFEGSNV